MPKKKKTLAKTLKRAGIKKKKKRTEPVWKGPEVDGVTQSLLSRFLCCKERFRLLVVEGLKPREDFNHRIEYGNMWHLCEEVYAADGAMTNWNEKLKEYSQKLCKKWPLHQEEISKWYNVCLIQFPIYLKYWDKHKSRKKQTQIMQEQDFAVPYKLPSGRIVLLKGKWDGVFQIGTRRNEKTFLKEHKTKGDIRPDQVERQLTFDLQTMIYIVALQACMPKVGQTLDEVKDQRLITIPDQAQIAGVLYNVVRRPLSGGKGTIRQHKPTKTKPQGESKEDFYKRLAVIIEENASEFFMRWEVTITQEDIERFKTGFLNPCLEDLCQWYNIISCSNPPYNSLHYRTPYGIYNVLAEGGSTDLDAYLLNGNEVGLERTNNLFPELE